MKSKVKFTVKNHTEQPIDQIKAKELKDLAEEGKIPQEIMDKAYLYSTLDYPEKLIYTNGEVVMVAPKSKEVVDASLIDVSTLKKGLILKKV